MLPVHKTVGAPTLCPGSSSPCSGALLSQPCSFCFPSLVLHPLEFNSLKSITFKNQPKGVALSPAQSAPQSTLGDTICVSVPPPLSTGQNGLLPLHVTLSEPGSCH